MLLLYSCCWHWEVLRSFNFGFLRAYLSIPNYVSEVAALAHGYLVFPEFYCVSSFPELEERCSHMSQIVFPAIAMYNNIVQVCSSDGGTFSEDKLPIIRWLVESERHNLELEEAVRCCKGCAGSRFLVHWDLPISPSQMSPTWLFFQ